MKQYIRKITACSYSVDLLVVFHGIKYFLRSDFRAKLSMFFSMSFLMTSFEISRLQYITAISLNRSSPMVDRIWSSINRMALNERSAVHDVTGITQSYEELNQNWEAFEKALAFRTTKAFRKRRILTRFVYKLHTIENLFFSLNKLLIFFTKSGGFC